MQRLILGLGLLVAVAGCAPPARPLRPVVVVSVPPQVYFVERIAGELVEVEVMVPAGASPETYGPSMAQMRALSRAAIYLKVGHPGFTFERTWLDQLLRDSPGIRVVDGSAGVRCTEDAHLWVTPAGVRVMTSHLAGALKQLLPEHEQRLQHAWLALQSEIDAVDADIRALLAGLAGRRFLVYHPSWGCFAREYGIVQVAIEHEGKEPSPARLARLIAESRRDGIRSVFVQPQVSSESARTVAEAIGAELKVVDPLAADWSANLRRVATAFAAALAEASPGAGGALEQRLDGS